MKVANTFTYFKEYAFWREKVDFSAIVFRD